tara:strand:+ start:431 stop:1387 length:957 start_codon:yes stop_codon:yes gene_type:complete
MPTIPKFTPFKRRKYDDNIEEMIDLGVEEGLFCTRVREPVPSFRKAQCEKVITQYTKPGEPNNNCFIVLGRDRPSTLVSGCGGLGFTSCGMIDLVVGRYALNSAHEMAKGKKPIGEEEVVNPNFITDAARIYITQKALNIDEYFGMKNNKTQLGVVHNKSAIGIKADNVRVIGRETVRVYCGRATNVEGLGKDGETNTLGGRLSRPRIDLVAGSEDNLQPAVLGDNLIEYLEVVENQIKNLNNNLMTISQHLMTINGTLGILTFGSPPFSSNFIGNVEMWTETVFGAINSELRKMNSLDDFEIIKGAKSITSNSVFIT